MIRFIGDTHSIHTTYNALVAEAHEKKYQTVQVGDFGRGFSPKPQGMWASDRYINGNHDDPAECRADKNWIPHGTFEEGIFYMGGARSIDAHMLIEGQSWWRDEELSHIELDAMIDRCLEFKPRVIVTHEGPMQFLRQFFGSGPPYYRMDNPSRTCNALTALFSLYQPEYWIFGHWHKDIRHTVDGTKFILLGIDSHVDLDV